MKQLIPATLLAVLCACNNAKKETETTVNESTNSTTPATNPENSSGNNPANTAAVSYMVNDTAKNFSGSILVQKDKSNLSAGNDLLGILTSTSSGDESLTVNFLFTLKPGTYPVVGLGLTKGNEVYGGILGGEPKMTNYKVNLTECTNMGSNNAGGNRWKISGSVDGDILIDALSIMKLSPRHHDSVKVSHFRFINISFDDNWEQLMEEATKMLKKNN